MLHDFNNSKPRKVYNGKNMIEISKNESALIRKLDKSVPIRQTVKSKKHRGKYFIEETYDVLKLLNYVRDLLFNGKEKSI